MPVCPTCHSEPSYQTVLRDKFIRENIDGVGLFLLGQPNQTRRIRDIDGVLQKHVDLGVSFWAYLALLLRVLLLGVNCTAIFYAFITYRIDDTRDWKFEIPTRVVVWVEFIIICVCLLWMTWRFFILVWAGLQELDSSTTNLFKRNLEVCTALRNWYSAAMLLDFNLLLMLRYVSPPAVMAALRKVKRKVYGKYGTRVHREQYCVDLCCCCCFYGRLAFCTMLWGSVVLVLTAAALMAVFIKVLQLRFLGTVDIRDWNIAELLLFGQFVVNMAWLDTRQKDRRAAKLELLYHGADAEESSEEREVVKLVEALALLVLRYNYNLFSALAVHHSITSEDISFIYIEDTVEDDRPKYSVRHEYKRSGGGGSGGGGGGGGGGGVKTAPPRQRPGLPQRVRQAASISTTATDVTLSAPAPLYSSQVVVDMSPRRDLGYQKPQQPQATSSVAATSGGGGGGRGGPTVNGSSADSGTGQPTAPVAVPLERFPFDFYSHGHPVGAPLRRIVQPADLKDRYEQSLWCGPSRM